jgi:hypothetical protein
VGQQISVLITPMQLSGSKAGVDDDGGHDEVYYFESKVQERPFLPIVHARTSWLQENPKWEQSFISCNTGQNGSSNSRNSNADSPRLRVMTYNLLADLYASREFDQDRRVTYQHCDLAFLSKRYRFPLLVYEILRYQPDILCLQEVDATIFDKLLRPVLLSQGYRGFYSNKVGAQLEGEFYPSWIRLSPRLSIVMVDTLCLWLANVSYYLFPPDKSQRSPHPDSCKRLCNVLVKGML